MPPSLSERPVRSRCCVMGSEDNRYEFQLQLHIPHRRTKQDPSLQKVGRRACTRNEVFDPPYDDVAAALNVMEAACRKLVSRARNRIGREEPGGVVPKERQDELLTAFQAAIATGTTAQLATLMREDIELRADGGGKALALLHPLSGKADVLGFVGGTLNQSWSAYQWQRVDINGARGALVFDGPNVVASISLVWDGQGCLSGIYIIRNPDKLARLGDADRTVQ